VATLRHLVAMPWHGPAAEHARPARPPPRGTAGYGCRPRRSSCRAKDTPRPGASQGTDAALGGKQGHTWAGVVGEGPDKATERAGDRCPGTTDDGRMRHITWHLPSAHAQWLVTTRADGAPDTRPGRGRRADEHVRWRG